MSKSDKPRCVICGALATRYGVRSGRSRLDGVWFFSWLARLYAMPPKHAIEEIWEPDEARYCESCRDDAESVLEEAHARVRSAYAAFTDRQRQELALLNHGGLDQGLRKRREEMFRLLGVDSPPRVDPPQLEQAQTETHVTRVASTGQGDA
jgi:hypothetical protein